jgi:hypothetical protein
MKVCPVGAELFYTDRGTDRQRGGRNVTKLIVVFSQFCEAKSDKKGGGNANDGTFLPPPIVFMCSIYFSQETAIISLRSSKQQVFMRKTNC